MKRYVFFIYRDTWTAGGDSEMPEERVIATDDPAAKARELCKGQITRVEYAKEPDASPEAPV